MKKKSKYIKIQIPFENENNEQEIKLKSQIYTKINQDKEKNYKKYDIYLHRKRGSNSEYEVFKKIKNKKSLKRFKKKKSFKKNITGSKIKLNSKPLQPSNKNQKKIIQKNFLNIAHNKNLEDLISSSKNNILKKTRSFKTKIKEDKKKMKNIYSGKCTAKKMFSNSPISKKTPNLIYKKIFKDYKKIKSQKLINKNSFSKKNLPINYNSYIIKDFKSRSPKARISTVDRKYKKGLLTAPNGKSNLKVRQLFYPKGHPKKRDSLSQKKSGKKYSNKSNHKFEEKKKDLFDINVFNSDINYRTKEKMKIKKIKNNEKQVYKKKKKIKSFNKKKKIVKNLFIDVDEVNNTKKNEDFPKTVPNKKKSLIVFMNEKKVFPKTTKNNKNFKIMSNITKINNLLNYKKKIIKITSQLNILWEIIQSKNDPYNIIREYVDIIQEDNFDCLIRFIEDKEIKRMFKESFIFERWTLLIVFYLFLEKKNKLINPIIFEIIKTICQNFELYLRFIYNELNDNDDLKNNFFEKILNNLKSYKYPLNQNLENILTIKNLLKNNLKKILDFLEDIQPYIEEKMKKGIKEIKKGIHLMGLDDSLDFLLDCFCDYFIKKGIVTVEYCDYEKDMQKKHNQIKTPFIDKKNKKKYTLVLDLDETLIHYKPGIEGGKFLKRPFVNEFLNEMAKFYELIIFTAAQQDYADWIIDQLDINKNISYRLYRHHTYLKNNTNVKDLSKIGRCLLKTIILDNISQNFQEQEDNGIFVKSWYKDQDDTVLQDIVPFLRDIVLKNCDNVRDDVKKIKEIFKDGFKRNINL